jgi:hypothetical protein
MAPRLICLVLALVCFVLAAFGVPKVSWRDLGYAFVVLSFLV